MAVKLGRLSGYVLRNFAFALGVPRWARKGLHGSARICSK